MPTATELKDSIILNIETDTGNEQVAAAETVWLAVSKALVPHLGGGGGGVTDGDKGDVVVSGSGSIWTIDTNVVSLSKLAQIASGRILGRVSALTGNVEALTAAQVVSMLGAYTSGGQAHSISISDVSPGGALNLTSEGTVDWCVPAGTMDQRFSNWWSKRMGGWLLHSFLWCGNSTTTLLTDSRPAWTLTSTEADTNRQPPLSAAQTMYGFSRSNLTGHGFSFRIPCSSFETRRLVFMGTQFDCTFRVTAKISVPDSAGAFTQQTLDSSTTDGAGKDYKIQIDYAGPDYAELIVDVQVIAGIGGSSVSHVYCNAIACKTI